MGTLKVWNDGAWEDALGGFLPLSGGVMSGAIDMNGNDLDRQGNIDFNGGKRIQFPNETAAKINLYAANFGIGVDSGTLAFFTPGGNTFRFRKDSYNGVDVAAIDASGVISAGRRVYTGQEKNSLAVTTGTYYQICGGGAHRFTVGAQNGQNYQVVSGAGAAGTVGGYVGGSMQVDINTRAGGKIFDRVISCSTTSNYYVLCIRAAVTASINIGYEAVDMVNGNPAAGDFSVISPKYTTGAVDL